MLAAITRFFLANKAQLAPEEAHRPLCPCVRCFNSRPRPASAWVTREERGISQKKEG